MDAYALRSKILLGLQNVTLVNGEQLSLQYSAEELLDIANTITHFIPKSTQFNMIDLHENVLKHIDGRPITDRLHGSSEHISTSDTVKDLKHKLFRVLFTLYILGEDLDDTLDELFAFYRSMVIDDIDIKTEVAENAADARTQYINDYSVVRLDNNSNELLPSTLTKKQFKNLLL